MYYLVSILLGLIPEVLFFTLFITKIKNIKHKRILLFFILAIVYTLCIFIQDYETFYYVLFIALIYISLKRIYKNKIQIIDIFIISVAMLYIFLTSYILFIFLNDNMSDYFILYIIDRILLIIPFIFINKLIDLYKIYYKLWNRNDNEKRPIKSITLRNISLILINILIFLIDIYLLKIS